MKADRAVTAAWEARERAYAPYSGFRVGAAVETAEGKIYPGCNVENASFGLTLCAERAAIVAAVAAGATSFVRLVVATDRDPPTPPCGACRQVMAEFGLDAVVDGVGPESSRKWQVRELLPDAFTKDQMA